MQIGIGRQEAIVHDKLILVRQKIYKERKALGIYSAWHLAADLVYDFALATRDGALPVSLSNQFVSLETWTIMNMFMMTAENALDKNKERFNVPERKAGSCPEAEMTLRKHVYLFTRGEVCKRDGIGHWWAEHHRGACSEDSYQKFLVENTDEEATVRPLAECPV